MAAETVNSTGSERVISGMKPLLLSLVPAQFAPTERGIRLSRMML